MDDLDNVLNPPANTPPSTPPKKRGRPKGKPKWNEQNALTMAYGMLKWAKEDDSAIIMQDYLTQNDLRHQLISELSELYPQFADVIHEIKGILASRIAQGALTNKYNGKFAQFYLACKAGYRLPVQQVETKSQVQVAAQGLTINFTEVKQ